MLLLLLLLLEPVVENKRLDNRREGVDRLLCVLLPMSRLLLSINSWCALSAFPPARSRANEEVHPVCSVVVVTSLLTADTFLTKGNDVVEEEKGGDINSRCCIVWRVGNIGLPHRPQYLVVLLLLPPPLPHDAMALELLPNTKRDMMVKMKIG